MSRFFLTVTVLFVLVASAIALKCYECTGNDDTCSKSTLEKDQDKYLKKCIGDTCVRQWSHKDGVTLVFNRCSTQLACGIAETACQAINDADNGGDCALACCSTDACNAGSTASISVLLLTVCSFIGLALLK